MPYRSRTRCDPSRLTGLRPRYAVAVEAIGNWYWIITEIEQAGLVPQLVHPRKAKLMMGMINKTDKLDVHGLNSLQRNDTLPIVWIRLAQLRDLRELTRVCMMLRAQRTGLKNRISATLAKYGRIVEGFSDACGVKARKPLLQILAELTSQTQWATTLLLAQLDFIQEQISA